MKVVFSASRCSTSTVIALHNTRDESSALSRLSRYKIKVNLLHHSAKAVRQYLWVISLTVRPFVRENCAKLH